MAKKKSKSIKFKKVSDRKLGKLARCAAWRKEKDYQQRGFWKHANVRREVNHSVGYGGFSRGTRQESEAFYSSREWKELRFKAFLAQGRKCACCGNTPERGAVLHVDHIQPRSLFPKLELKLTNLQILCADCNIGKSNKFTTDFMK